MKTLNIFILLLFACVLPKSVVPGNAHQQPETEELELSENVLDDGTIQIIGKNNAFCPISVELTFEQLKNYTPEQRGKNIVVIPASESAIINTLKVKKKKVASGYGFSIAYVLGDTENAKHNDDHIYQLPFQKGKSCFIGQGYKGNFSHFDEYALDFDMKEGTKVFAARKGIVVKVKVDSNKGCKKSKCKSLGNFILIYHPEDGSFANYYHLQHNGSSVNVGDEVEAGQHIGFSGNTGWSSGPHLHFEVYTAGWTQNYTLPTKFLIQSGESGLLEEGKSYTSF